MKTKRKEVGAPPLLRRPFSASIDTKSRQKWQKRGSQRKLDAFWQMSVSELVPTLDLPHYKKKSAIVEELEERQQVSPPQFCSTFHPFVLE